MAKFAIARGSSQWLQLLRCVTALLSGRVTAWKYLGYQSGVFRLHPGDTWVVSRGYSGCGNGTDGFGFGDGKTGT